MGSGLPGDAQPHRFAVGQYRTFLGWNKYRNQ